MCHRWIYFESCLSIYFSSFLMQVSHDKRHPRSVVFILINSNVFNSWVRNGNKNIQLMEPSTHLISEAGKRYQRQKSIRPLNTPDRLRMYNSIEVKPVYRQPLIKKPMETIDRAKIDSYLLRHRQEMVVNTNYHVNYEPVAQTSPRQSFAKAKRITLEIKDDDYSLPLMEDCDQRCYDAFITLPHQDTIVNASDLHKAKAQHHHLNFAKQLSRQKLSQSLDLKKMNSIASTSESEVINFDTHADENIKRRRRTRNLQLHEALKRIRLFDHDIGHRYGDALFTPKQSPEYDIQSCREELVKKSMQSPRGHVRFDSFRDKIAVRSDRLDPYWGMTLNYEHTHENPQWKNAKTVRMEKISERRLNEVYSKYPIRQSMSLVTPVNWSPEKSMDQNHRYHIDGQS